MTVSFKPSDALSQVNMTPMIDCVFQLLLFFMLASQFKDFEDQDLSIELPSASEAAPLVAETETIYVNVNSAGEYFVRNRKLSLEELDDYLQQAAANNRLTTKVEIRGDRRVALDAVAQVLNLCAKAQITNTKIATQGQGN